MYLFFSPKMSDNFTNVTFFSLSFFSSACERMKLFHLIVMITVRNYRTLTRTEKKGDRTRGKKLSFSPPLFPPFHHGGNRAVPNTKERITLKKQIKRKKKTSQSAARPRSPPSASRQSAFPGKSEETDHIIAFTKSEQNLHSPCTMRDNFQCLRAAVRLARCEMGIEPLLYSYCAFSLASSVYLFSFYIYVFIHCLLPISFYFISRSCLSFLLFSLFVKKTQTNMIFVNIFFLCCYRNKFDLYFKDKQYFLAKYSNPSNRLDKHENK